VKEQGSESVSKSASTSVERAKRNKSQTEPVKILELNLICEPAMIVLLRIELSLKSEEEQVKAWISKQR
jgi:hypothetical protein